MNQKIRNFRKQSIIDYIKRNINLLEKTAEPIAIAYERWMKVYEGIPCTYGRFSKVYDEIKRKQL